MSEQHEYVLTEAEDVYGALRRLAMMDDPVSLQIDGSSEAFSTYMVDTDLKSRSFLLDRVFPYSGNDLIRAGNRFTIKSDSDGIRIEFRVSGRIMFQPKKGLYRAEFPEQVLYLQRRDAYRVTILPSHNIHLLLGMSDQKGDLAGALIDLSSTGFKAKFKGNVKKRLQEQSQFSQARIRFNRQHDMDCSLILHYATVTEKGETICGFSFNSISGQAQRFLDKLITDLQFEERVRQNPELSINALAEDDANTDKN